MAVEGAQWVIDQMTKGLTRLVELVCLGRWHAKTRVAPFTDVHGQSFGDEALQLMLEGRV